jgi:predicted acetyltransferase
MTDHIMFYAGNLGYKVNPAYRGRRFAARAIQLLLPIARHHGMSELWIRCNPENCASRKTCEHAGAELIEIIDVPPGNNLYDRGDRLNCRYLLRL